MQSDAQPRRGAFAFIFVTILLDMLTLGLIVPVLPKLIVNFLGGDIAEAARYSGLFETIWALMQFAFSPVLGLLSDRYGRRPLILLSNFGTACDYAIMALAPTIGWLFVGRIFSGITSASVTTAYAYIADVVPAPKRAGAYGMVGAAFGGGFVLGPAVGGVLGSMNPRLPFWVAGGLSLLSALYGFFVLPESLPPEMRAARIAWERANPLGSLRLLRSHAQLFGLAAAVFLTDVAHQVLPNVFVLYTIYRYGWSESVIGLTLAWVGVWSIVISGFGVKPIVARLGEQRALLVGLLCGALGFAIYGLAPNGTLFWLGTPVMAFWGLASPASQALMTHRMESSAQGELQGALGSMNGVAMLIGPALFTQTFSLLIGPGNHPNLPGAPWFLATLLMLAALVVVWRAIAPAASLSGERCA
ncbi:MAG TPA: TCR/Tet family MFS transporter [Candidatus Acidoferrales bacterium]|nr:TCR/Tet family MFS transporter [Candidatus Acidoferrales bacterium]